MARTTTADRVQRVLSATLLAFATMAAASAYSASAPDQFQQLDRIRRNDREWSKETKEREREEQRAYAERKRAYEREERDAAEQKKRARKEKRSGAN